MIVNGEDLDYCAGHKFNSKCTDLNFTLGDRPPIKLSVQMRKSLRHLNVMPFCINPPARETFLCIQGAIFSPLIGLAGRKCDRALDGERETGDRKVRGEQKDDGENEGDPFAAVSR